MDLPKSFCDEMKRILGDEYDDYLSSMEMERKYGLRVNTSKISVEDFLKIVPFHQCVVHKALWQSKLP